MLNDLDEDPIYNLSLVKQAGLKSTDDIELPGTPYINLSILLYE